MSEKPNWTQSELGAIRQAARDTVHGADGRDRGQASWALRNMIKALGMLSWQNTYEDWFRLEVAKEILKQRARSRVSAKRSRGSRRNPQGRSIADLSARYEALLKERRDLLANGSTYDRQENNQNMLEARFQLERAKGRRNPVPPCCYSNPRRKKSKRRLGKTVTRTVTSRTKTVTRTNPGLRDPRYKPYGLGFMPSTIGLRGYRGSVSFFSANGLSDKAKVLKRLFPAYTKADHKSAAVEHRLAEIRYEKLWSRTVDKASQETFGRPYQVFDYKISGIARDEYPERYKKILRMAAHRGTDHANIAAAHAYAARHFRARK